MGKPAPYDIDLYRGDKFTLFFRVRAKNPDGSSGDYLPLTGSTPKAQIRSDPDSTTVIAEFTATLGDQDAFPGSVLLTLGTAITSTLVVPAGAVWDVQVSTGGEPKTYLAGKVTMTKDVTRA